MDIYTIQYTENGIINKIWCSEYSLKLYKKVLNKNGKKIIYIKKNKKKNVIQKELVAFYNSKLAFLYYRVKKYNITREKSSEYRQVLKNILKSAEDFSTAKLFEKTEIFKYVKSFDEKEGDQNEKCTK